MQYLLDKKRESAHSLLPLFRWISLSQESRTPFEQIAAIYLPSGIRLADGGTWWNADEYEEWLQTSARASRHAGRRSNEGNTSSTRGKRRRHASRSRTSAGRSTAASATGSTATASSRKATKNPRPPNILKSMNFDNMLPQEALTTLKQSYPNWVRVYFPLTLPLR